MFCFIEVMESVNGVNSNINAHKNDVNAHMKNSPLNVGVIIPPDDHYRPVLYSDRAATAEFCNLNRDIYQSMKKSKDIREKKTPLSVKIIFGIVALCASVPLIKKLIR